MKLISDIHDYYDGCTYGAGDPHYIFKRKPEHFRASEIEVDAPHDLYEFMKLELPKAWFGVHSRYRDIVNGVPIFPVWQTSTDWNDKKTTILIFFCGKFYYGVATEFGNRSYSKPKKYAYTYESYIKYVKANDKKVYKHLMEFERSGKNCKDCFDLVDAYNKKNDKALQDWYHKTGIPIVVFSDHFSMWENVGINVPLKDVNFQQVFDAYSAFQELENFLGTIGGQSPKMVEISNEDKIAKHGFDTKMGFRKRKKK